MNEQSHGDTTRELLLLEAGGRVFALAAEAVEATAEDLRPTPLPFAPPAVLGVVSLRGHARTVLDAAALLPRA
ncbi:MAG TPA: chemotaxis protein CheW, partial [Pyrinomonadaceae bacterium]|nr:chemotaxis protein CheW [Pyrinomonadaceae bacterium]